MQSTISYRRPSPGIVRQYPPCTEADFAPYVALDHEFRHLRREQEFIRQVPETSPSRYPSVEDIEMDVPTAVKSKLGSGTTIGTSGVATCVVICGRAQSKVQGERIFGINHHSGICDAADSIADLKKEMDQLGAIDPKFWLVGGLVVPRACLEAGVKGSYDMEKEMLQCSGMNMVDGSGPIEIVGFALHRSAGEYSGNWNDPRAANALNVVLREDGIYYRKAPLF